MELVIEIPEAFEGHFNQDRFKDSLERILEDCKHSAILSGIYEFETIEMLIRAFKNGTPLQKGHGRLGDLDKLEREMYHKAFETDTDLQRWDSGCWIRYKMFEIAVATASTIIEADGGGEE